MPYTIDPFSPVFGKQLEMSHTFSSAFEKQLEMLQLRESHKVYMRAKIRADQISVNAACLCFEKSQSENEVITPPKKPRNIPPEIAAHILEFLGGRILPEHHITGHRHRASHPHAPPPHERLPRKILGLRVGWELEKAAPSPRTGSQCSQTPPPSHSWFSFLSCARRHRTRSASSVGPDVSATMSKEQEDDPPSAATPVDRAKYKLYLPGCYVDGPDDHYHPAAPDRAPRGVVDVVDYSNLSGVVCYRPLSAMTFWRARDVEVHAERWHNFWFDERQLRRDREDFLDDYTNANVRISAPERGGAGGYVPVQADADQCFHPKALRNLWAGVGTSVHFDLGGAYTNRSALRGGTVRVRSGNIGDGGTPRTVFSAYLEPCRRLFLDTFPFPSRVIVSHSMACDAWAGGALEVDCQPQQGTSLSFRAIEYTIVLEGDAAAAIIRDHLPFEAPARAWRDGPPPREDERCDLDGQRFLEYCEKESGPRDAAALVEFNWQWKCGKSRRHHMGAETEEAATWCRSREAAAAAREDFLDAAKVLNVPIFSARRRYRAQVLQDARPEVEDDAHFDLEDEYLRNMEREVGLTPIRIFHWVWNGIFLNNPELLQL